MTTLAIGIGIGVVYPAGNTGGSPPPASPELDFSHASNSMYLTLGVV